MDLPGYEQPARDLAEQAERHLVLHPVANQRTAGRVGECVRVPPASVRTFGLHIHETQFRIEDLDERAPTELETEERELVVDDRAGPHRDGLGAADLEVQSPGRDALEVRRVSEEGEHLASRPPDQLLLLENVLHNFSERSSGPKSYKLEREVELPSEGLVRTNEEPEGTRGNVEGQESDDDLMAKFCRGDETAFGVLYDRYAPQLEAFLRRLVRDQTLAEDLLQTTFLSFVRARGRYVTTAGLRAWIFSIAANAARDALRRRGARREDALGPEIGNIGGASAAMSDPPLARAIDDALRQLPDDQREAVLLHKMHGLSFPEVASALGTTVGAAKVRAHRGYQRLRSLLAPLENL